MRNSIAWLVALGCMGLISGCSASGQEPEAGVQGVSEEIIGGTAVDVATRRSLGLIDVSSPKGGCSGSLLSSDWVLTATHCIDFSNPSANSFSAPRANGVLDTRTGALPLQVAGTDVTIVKLSPATASMTWPNVTRSASSTNPSTLVGKSVTCYGRGNTTYASPNGLSGFGNWRTLTKTISSFNGSALLVNADSSGSEITAPGDSGGGCFVNGDAIAVVSFGSWTCADPSTQDLCKATITHVNSGGWATFADVAYINRSVAMKPVAFQANTNELWLDQSGVGSPTGFGMLTHTVPSLATLSGGGVAVAFQANTGNLWLDVNGAGTDQQFGMKAGTSPSVAVLPNGQTVTAFQANTGNLWLDVNGAGTDQQLGMQAGTSPSVAVLPNGQIAVAFQANTGNLWLDVNGVGSDQQLGMKAGTSPSIAVLPNGQIAVAFQANTGNLWTEINGVGVDQQLGMKSGTSPSIAVLSNGQVAVAFQANTGNLWTEINGVGSDQHLGMMASASPSIVPLASGGWQVAFEANTGDLWIDFNGTGFNQALGMNTP